jgi:hypothetical protein
MVMKSSVKTKTRKVAVKNPHRPPEGSFLARQLEDMRKLCAMDPDPAFREVPEVNGELDLTKVKAILSLQGSMRVIGAMLDEILTELKARKTVRKPKARSSVRKR